MEERTRCTGHKITAARNVVVMGGWKVATSGVLVVVCTVCVVGSERKTRKKITNMQTQPIINPWFNAFVTKNPNPTREEWIESGFYNTPIYYAYLQFREQQMGNKVNEQGQVVNDRFNEFVTKNPYPTRQEWIDSGFYGTDIYRAYLQHVAPKVGKNYDDPRLENLQQRMDNNKGTPENMVRYFDCAFKNINDSIRYTL